MAKLREARKLTEDLMKQHGLKGWWVEFSNMQRVYGNCNSSLKRIKLSKPLVSINEVERTRLTVLHEIAHALTPGHHHDEVWRKKCLEIGGNGARTHDETNTVLVREKYLGVCPKCHVEVRAFRRPKAGTACRVCCQKYARGMYHPDYKFVWSESR